MKKIQNTKAKNNVTLLLCIVLINGILGILSLTTNLKLLKQQDFFFYWGLTNSILLFVIWMYDFFSFRYEGEGGVLSFRNQDFLGLRTNKICEFPQEKLAGYTIITNAFISKKLVLFIKSSNKKKQVKVTYNISCLTQEELDFLDSTLARTVLLNKN